MLSNLLDFLKRRALGEQQRNKHTANVIASKHNEAAAKRRKKSKLKKPKRKGKKK